MLFVATVRVALSWQAAVHRRQFGRWQYCAPKAMRAGGFVQISVMKRRSGAGSTCGSEGALEYTVKAAAYLDFGAKKEKKCWHREAVVV